MRAVRDGDVAQLGVLFERYHGSLFDFFCRLTGSPTVAEDLVQDVFVIDLRPATAPAPQETRPRGRYRLEVNRAIYGTVGGGGPEIELRSFNGDVYPRRGQ